MNATTTELTWVRTTHQDRSRRTLERLLDAAETLLQARGIDAVSVADIVQAAESSVGAFYARFRDKDGLLHHLHERFCEEAVATCDAALEPGRWEGAGTREIVSEVVRFLETIVRSRSGLLRVFLLRGCTDPEFQQRDRRMRRHVLEQITALLMARRSELSHPEPALAIAFGLETVMAMLRDRHVLAISGQELWPDPPGGLAPELVRTYCRYLGLAPQGDPPATPAKRKAAP